MILLVWVLNFAISWFNAWGCGKTWTESKHAGGFAHLMNWMGAIMAAAGFTWCYLVIIGFFGTVIPIEQDNGTTAALLTPVQLQAFADLGYMVIIFPILGSGLAITIHAWGVAWRRRSFGTGAIAAYDTFAMVYNISSAIDYMPGATGRLGDFFFGKDSKDDEGKSLVLLLVLLALAGGILTTYAIITRTAKATARNRAWEYRSRFEA